MDLVGHVIQLVGVDESVTFGRFVVVVVFTLFRWFVVVVVSTLLRRFVVVVVLTLLRWFVVVVVSTLLRWFVVGVRVDVLIHNRQILFIGTRIPDSWLGTI